MCKKQFPNTKKKLIKKMAARILKKKNSIKNGKKLPTG